jgi:CheY-like chemotaxis protein
MCDQGTSDAHLAAPATAFLTVYGGYLRVSIASGSALLLLSLPKPEGLMIEDQNVGLEDARPRPPARVLIVDDEESIRRLVSKWTDVPSFEVKAASSAEAALLIMHAWTADVVVCDIRMPRYSGVWLIEHLRTLYPSTAIVISTGYGELDPALMVRARITGYLAKPYDRDMLIASLEQAIH